MLKLAVFAKFARRGAEFGAEGTDEVREVVEAGGERDLGHRSAGRREATGGFAQTHPQRSVRVITFFSR